MTSPLDPPSAHAYALRPVRVADAPSVLAAHLSASDMARQGTVTTLAQAREQVAWLLEEDRALSPSAAGGWGLERLELGHRVNNPASGAVARAAGFVQEGTERGKFLIDGERVDVLTYGRLRSDPGPAVPGLPWQP
ncbi:MAG: GNAT family N-acetyltransferase [Actinomycetales bacterium]|nr:GNAT family N-acetyltransferase [Actinomycetales bacterium]